MRKNKKERAYHILLAVEKVLKQINNGTVPINRKYSAK